MLKHDFLRSEYERILGSGEFVYSAWRDSFDVFCADLWDITPPYKGSRYFAVVDSRLGFGPGNVEIRYRGTTKRTSGKRSTAKAADAGQVSGKSKTKKKAADNGAKELRRQKLALEFQRWNERQAHKSG